MTNNTQKKLLDNHSERDDLNHTKVEPVISKRCNLRRLATNLIVMHYHACHLFCSYQYNDVHSGYNPRGYIFLTIAADKKKKNTLGHM